MRIYTIKQNYIIEIEVLLFQSLFLWINSNESYKRSQYDYESLFNNIINVSNHQIWDYKNRRG